MATAWAVDLGLIDEPKASSTRDQPASGMPHGAERRFAGGGISREAGAGENLTKTDIEIQGLAPFMALETTLTRQRHTVSNKCATAYLHYCSMVNLI